MLTILGERLRLCDRLSRRAFLQIGGLAMGGLCLPQLLRAEAQLRHQQSAQVRHHDLPVRRPAASGHGRSQAGCSRRGSRRIQADPHQRARHRHLRASAAHGDDDGSPGRHSLPRRLRGTPCVVSVHDRPGARAAAAAEVGRRWVRPCRSCKGRYIRPCRRSSACRRR